MLGGRLLLVKQHLLFFELCLKSLNLHLLLLLDDGLLHLLDLVLLGKLMRVEVVVEVLVGKHCRRLDAWEAVELGLLALHLKHVLARRLRVRDHLGSIALQVWRWHSAERSYALENLRVVQRRSNRTGYARNKRRRELRLRRVQRLQLLLQCLDLLLVGLNLLLKLRLFLLRSPRTLQPVGHLGLMLRLTIIEHHRDSLWLQASVLLHSRIFNLLGGRREQELGFFLGTVNFGE